MCLPLIGEDGWDPCVVEPCCYDTVYSSLYLGHVFGEGVGYDSGYSTVGVLWLPNTSCEKVAFFVDLRAHYLDKGEWAANGGVGLRIAPDPAGVVYGINGYFAYRSDEEWQKHYTQAGIGLEVLGCCLDLRVNGYLSIQKRHVVQRCRFFYDEQYFVFRDQIRHALSGADFEIGGNLFCISSCINVYGAIGGYVFDGNVYTKPAGGRVRLMAHWTDYFSVQGIVTHDNLFGTRVQGEVAIHIPLGCPPPCECVSLRNRSKRPYRQEIIPIEEFCCWHFNY